MRLHGSCTTDQGAPRFDHEWQGREFGLAIALSNSATIAQLPAAVRGRSRRYLYRRGHKGEKPQRSPHPWRATLSLQRLRDLRGIRVEEGMVSQEKAY